MRNIKLQFINFFCLLLLTGCTANQSNHAVDNTTEKNKINNCNVETLNLVSEYTGTDYETYGAEIIFNELSGSIKRSLLIDQDKYVDQKYNRMVIIDPDKERAISLRNLAQRAQKFFKSGENPDHDKVATTHSEYKSVLFWNIRGDFFCLSSINIDLQLHIYDNKELNVKLGEIPQMFSEFRSIYGS